MHLTNLEKRLSDDDGRYRDDVLMQLMQWRDEMACELVCGSSFENFSRNLALRQGCAAAIQVVESLARHSRAPDR